MKKLILILFLAFSSAVIGQNYIARMASTLPLDDPYRIQNGPTNWAVEWVNVGTNLAVPLQFGTNYIFVGNAAARDAFIAARTTTTWNNWNTSTGGVFAAKSEQTNNIIAISNNLATVRNLFQSNINFMFTVATNRPALVMTNNGNANLIISNQIVTLSRLFNQLAPFLREAYLGN